MFLQNHYFFEKQSIFTAFSQKIGHFFREYPDFSGVFPKNNPFFHTNPQKHKIFVFGKIEVIKYNFALFIHKTKHCFSSPYPDLSPAIRGQSHPPAVHRRKHSIDRENNKKARDPIPDGAAKEIRCYFVNNFLLQFSNYFVPLCAILKQNEATLILISK